MKQIDWFNRSFNFNSGENIFPSIVERLEGTSLRLNNKISLISTQNLDVNLNQKWSIKENIGHLIDVEPLWMGRLNDILNGDEIMRAADLENKKTFESKHNLSPINDLLKEFNILRKTSLNALEKLTSEDVFKSSLHPRLMQPMRIIDLFLFVAEHDDHHLARITELNRMLTS